jgi:hypothetical protein
LGPENIFKIKINDPTFIVKNRLLNQDSEEESEEDTNESEEDIEESEEDTNESEEELEESEVSDEETINELLTKNSKINKKIIAK